MGELIDSRAGWIGDHLRLYRRTGGREGHFVDVRDWAAMNSPRPCC